MDRTTALDSGFQTAHQGRFDYGGSAAEMQRRRDFRTAVAYWQNPIRSATVRLTEGLHWTCPTAAKIGYFPTMVLGVP
ncbi:hypothetical protein Q31b_01840 [Novipirellula aureliae]|uniref:Uncharacterized protein n=1 Tax=Novipirellula aureliae TaxID=2527966 RepID=A0A5C6E5S6_9BACT|nr:hypothetical protein Q31b_01840 [Novipirellula aureliae]